MMFWRCHFAQKPLVADHAFDQAAWKCLVVYSGERICSAQRLASSQLVVFPSINRLINSSWAWRQTASLGGINTNTWRVANTEHTEVLKTTLVSTGALFWQSQSTQLHIDQMDPNGMSLDCHPFFKSQCMWVFEEVRNTFFCCFSHLHPPTKIRPVKARGLQSLSVVAVTSPCCFSANKEKLVDPILGVYGALLFMLEL